MSERRLHPAAILDEWIVLMKRIGWYALVPIVARGGGNLLAMLLMGVVVVIAFVAVALVYWLRFRYEVHPDRIVVRGGLLQRFERTIPVARVQSIDTIEKLRHRLFGVVELRIETIGSGQTEGKLSAIARADAEQIRQALLPSSLDDSVRLAPPLVRLTPGQVLLAGVTGGRVAVLALILGTVSDLLPEDFEPDKLAGSGVPSVLSIVLFAAAGLALVMLVSLVATVLVYWDFTVRREGDRLVIERGLLERRRAVAPLHRVQIWRVQQNLIRRPFGLATVTIRIAGYGGEGQETQVSSVLMPVGRVAQAFDLVSGLLPEPVDVAEIELEPAPRRALRRRITRAVLAGVAAVAIMVPLVGPVGTWGLAVVVGGLGLAFAAWRALGHSVDGPYAVTRSGVLVRTTTVVPLANVQVLRLASTPMQRLARLASLKIKVPRASTSVIDLDRARADDRFDSLRAAIVPARGSG